MEWLPATLGYTLINLLVVCMSCVVVLDIICHNCVFKKMLTLSAPQDFTNVIKTRSRLRVWVGMVHI